MYYIYTIINNNTNTNIMKTLKQIMIEAHKIAKTLEGDYSARMSMALKMAWANREVRKEFSLYVDMIVRETEKAILVRRDNKVAGGLYSNNQFWLPKSQITIGADEILMPFWLANKLVDNGNIQNFEVMMQK